MNNKLDTKTVILMDINDKWGTSKLIQVISGALAAAGVAVITLANAIPDNPNNI